MTVISSRGGGVQTNVFSGRGTVFAPGGVFGIVQTGRGGMVVSGGDMVISGGRVVSGGGDVTVIESEEEVRVVVYVPLGTPITIDEGLFGRYEIDNIVGPLDLRMKGDGNVTAG